MAPPDNKVQISVGRKIFDKISIKFFKLFIVSGVIGMPAKLFTRSCKILFISSCAASLKLSNIFCVPGEFKISLASSKKFGDSVSKSSGLNSSEFGAVAASFSNGVPILNPWHKSPNSSSITLIIGVRTSFNTFIISFKIVLSRNAIGSSEYSSSGKRIPICSIFFLLISSADLVPKTWFSKIIISNSQLIDFIPGITFMRF